MKIEVFNKTLEFNKPVSLLEILNIEKIEKTKYICAKVNKRLRELTYIVEHDCEVEFLDLTSRDSMNIYQASLRFLFVMAAKELFPNSNIVFNYSISRSLYIDLTNIDVLLNQNILNLIENKMKELVELDIPIIKREISKLEASEMYNKKGLNFKTKIFKYRAEETVNYYECNGYENYMFSYMVPSTKFISKFKLSLYSPGIILQYPRAELNGQIPEFVNEMVFGRVLKEATKWGKITNSSVLYTLNETIEENKWKELISICETRHNYMLAELGDAIRKDIDSIKLIAIAGPSSSGKTTFCKRLRIELLSKGIKPVMISIDDYYKPKSDAPEDEFGNRDVESIYALDLALFNDNIYRLIQGEEVTLPKFDFTTGKRLTGKTIRIDDNQPIMIEGIHALNDILTPSIPGSQKYKIYIAPQSQIHIDEHNPISMSDIRLIRRIVRDARERNSPAELTLSMWPSVRRGEFKWIYPYQDQANYVFNSELTYELAVMKKYALKNLKEISINDEHYITANRILKFLKYIIDIDDKWVPCNSILREFIGESIFNDK